ncbi:rhomboid family intramembrane serine protease [Conexibacter sp. W3-3-2]|uniref:Rhomboid family intramembrane serine protease n=1 Tax=Paraconexibacter algicola TaxID=2133960 RepID=A0A2T4UG16_9ACTN|nr:MULTISPECIES: rhomboid family intramembrane serine protease [Solirubrobacterales]MTD44426.1 rhomboid family intramembrane serine protease [Conexibacter sp. W3-3-2]PTL58192.1 rhomboid family intramembrane serine protease [Paraconexibacter algicola]
MATEQATGTPTDPRVAGLKLVVGMAALMWVLEVVDVAADHRLDRYGIEPREADGLLGILFAPFLHVGFGHLAGNTVPFLALGAGIALSGIARVAIVTAIVGVVGGLGTWLTGSDNSVHLGASGLVFGYATYLISRGVFERNLVHLAVAAVVAAGYGGVLLGGILPEDGVSWQGHLFGAIGGILAARLLASEEDRMHPRARARARREAAI